MRACALDAAQGLEQGPDGSGPMLCARLRSRFHQNDYVPIDTLPYAQAMEAAEA